MITTIKRAELNNIIFKSISTLEGRSFISRFETTRKHILVNDDDLSILCKRKEDYSLCPIIDAFDIMGMDDITPDELTEITGYIRDIQDTEYSGGISVRCYGKSLISIGEVIEGVKGEIAVHNLHDEVVVRVSNDDSCTLILEKNMCSAILYKVYYILAIVVLCRRLYS